MGSDTKMAGRGPIGDGGDTPGKHTAETLDNLKAALRDQGIALVEAHRAVERAAPAEAHRAIERALWERRQVLRSLSELIHGGGSA